MPKENRTTANLKAAFLLSALTFSSSGQAQSRDWQSVVYREPQVRYLLTDMTLSGRSELCEKYAVEEMDPDSHEAIRLWRAGVRVINTNEFERRWITNGVHTAKPVPSNQSSCEAGNSPLGWQLVPASQLGRGQK